MAKFILEARSQIFTTDRQCFRAGTTVTINLGKVATPATVFTNPEFKQSIIRQFKAQGIYITPEKLGTGFWKIVDFQR